MTTGMVIMRPTSIVVAGGGTETASIRAAGGVEFANATSLSLNGVFTSGYDDYMIVIRYVGSTSSAATLRLRASGSDNSTASSYVRQILAADNTTITALRFTDNYGGGPETNATARSGATIYMYGPELLQPTAWRFTSVVGASSAKLTDVATTHNQSTSYDGLSFICASGTFTGLVTVYGLAQ
jgi:hypothetical protein